MANIVGTRNQVEPNRLQVCKGIGEELILRLLDCDGAMVTKNAYIAEGEKHTDTKGDLSYSYAFDTEKFKYVTLKMALEAGVDILFHVYFSDVMMDGNRVRGVIFEGKSGRRGLRQGGHRRLRRRGRGDARRRSLLGRRATTRTSA